MMSIQIYWRFLYLLLIVGACSKPVYLPIYERSSITVETNEGIHIEETFSYDRPRWHDEEFTYIFSCEFDTIPEIGKTYDLGQHAILKYKIAYYSIWGGFGSNRFEEPCIAKRDVYGWIRILRHSKTKLTYHRKIWVNHGNKKKILFNGKVSKKLR